jgi:hypothetical protein
MRTSADGTEDFLQYQSRPGLRPNTNRIPVWDKGTRGHARQGHFTREPNQLRNWRLGTDRQDELDRFTGI